MIKIIKTSTYNDLLESKSEAESLRTHLLLSQQFYEREKKELLLNYRIRQCILGKRGIGKSTLLKSKILPQLSNYFVIDATGEYGYLPKESVYCVDRAISLAENKQNILNAIRQNAGKTIVVEEFGMLDNDVRPLFELIKDGNFILVSQSVRRITPILEHIDTVFDLGAIDSVGAYPHKFIKITRAENLWEN